MILGAEVQAPEIFVRRRALDQFHFDKEYGRRWNYRRVQKNCRDFAPTKRFLKETLKSAKECCDLQRVGVAFLRLLPILHWLPRYNFRSNVVVDAVAGITVGIMHIPQGMAYASLAGLSPVYGLYTSFFPSLVYAFFGTSHHVSLGTLAIVSLMVGSAIDRYRVLLAASASASGLQSSTSANVLASTLIYADGGSLNEISNAHKHISLDVAENVIFDQSHASPLSLTSTPSLPHLASTSFGVYDGALSFGATAGAVDSLNDIFIATALSFAVGLILLCMALLRLGFLSVYLSDQLVSGYTTGASVMVFTAQIDKVFGIPRSRHEGPFCLFKIYADIFSRLPETNVPTLIASLMCICIIFLVKTFVNDRYKKRLLMPIPIDLILIIIATIISYFTYPQFNLKIVGPIPTGLPPPQIPDLSLASQLLTDALVMAIIIYSLTVSMAKIFAKRHGYKIDPNQELLAYGVVCITNSFFSAWPAGASLSRSSVQDSVGSKSLLTGVVSSCVILIVLLWLGPLFEYLPMCVLASIIIVALKSMFMQAKELVELWPVSKIDFSIWLFAFLATLILDVSYGLGASLIYAVLTVVFRSQRPPTLLLGRTPNTDIYTDLKSYKSAEEVEGVKIFRFDSPLYFANAELFRLQLYRFLQFDPQEVLEQLERQEKQAAKANKLSQAPARGKPHPPPTEVASAAAAATANESGGEARKTSETSSTDPFVIRHSSFAGASGIKRPSRHVCLSDNPEVLQDAPCAAALPADQSNTSASEYPHLYDHEPVDEHPHDNTEAPLITRCPSSTPIVTRVIPASVGDFDSSGSQSVDGGEAARSGDRLAPHLTMHDNSFGDSVFLPPHGHAVTYASSGGLLSASASCDASTLRERRASLLSLVLERNPELPHHIVIDCSGFNYIDVMGAQILRQIYLELEDINVTAFFANCKAPVLQMFEATHFYEDVPKNFLFVSIEDAVVTSKLQIRTGFRFSIISSYAGTPTRKRSAASNATNDSGNIHFHLP